MHLQGVRERFQSGFPSACLKDGVSLGRLLCDLKLWNDLGSTAVPVECGEVISLRVFSGLGILQPDTSASVQLPHSHFS